MKDHESQQIEILKLLHEDRERGAELLLETYTPLLWSVCRKRLSDSEDIKECINDVFTDFCLNLNKYDPRQARLSNYLAMIADRKAISYYRRNRRRGQAEAEAANCGTQEQAELHSSLEEAISQLQPKDAQIIRQKYYGGLSYREIAKQLGITEEAAKKRGVRSLRKIAKWLLISLLIIALLAGCAYAVNRYFRYLRGVGLIADTNAAMYQIQDTPDPIAINNMTVYPLSVSYADGSVVVTAVFHPEEDTYNSTLFLALTGSYNLSVNGGNPVSSRTFSNMLAQFVVDVSEAELTFNENGQLPLHLELIPDPETSANLLKQFNYKMELSSLCWDVTLDEVEAIQDLSELGYYLETDLADFLILTHQESSTDTGHSYTYISLCPIYKEDGYAVSDRLSTCYTMLDGREQEHITLTDAEGNTYSSLQLIAPPPDSELMEYSLCFQDLPPGEYTLNIPSLCYQAEYDMQTLQIPLPKEDGVPLSGEQSLTLPDGSGIRITGMTRQTTSEPGKFMTDYWEDGVQYWVQEDDILTIWHYTPEYEVSTDSKLPLVGISVENRYSYNTEDGLSPITPTTGMYGVADGLSSMDFGIRDALEMDAPDVMTLVFHAFYYGDLQDYAISVTIQ